MKVHHAALYLNPTSTRSSAVLQSYLIWKWLVVAMVVLVIVAVLVSRLRAKVWVQPSANTPLPVAVAPPPTPLPPVAPEAVVAVQEVKVPLSAAVEVGQLRLAIGSWSIGGVVVSQGSTVYVVGQNANLFRVAVSSSQGGEREWWLSAEKIMEMTQ